MSFNMGEKITRGKNKTQKVHCPKCKVCWLDFYVMPLTAQLVEECSNCGYSKLVVARKALAEDEVSGTRRLPQSRD